MRRKRTFFDREKRNVFISCNIKFNEIKMIKNEFYGEQEIGKGYGDEGHVEFVPSSRSKDEIKKEDVESDLKLEKDQDVQLQNSRDKKGLLRHQGEVKENVSNPTDSHTHRWPNLHIQRLSAHH